MDYKKIHRHFLRYLAVFSVPVLCMATLLLYSNIMSGYSTTQKDALNQLSQASAQIDWFSTSMQSTALHMSSNERLSSLSAERFDASSYTSTRVFGLLRSYEQNLPAGISMLFYLRGGKNIYSHLKFISYQDFVSSNDYEPDLGQADLYLNLNSVPNKRVVGIDNDQHNTKYCAAIYYPVPEIAEKQLSTVCFLISREYADGLVEQFFPNMQALAFILDKNDKVIYNSAYELYSNEQMTEIIRNNPQSCVMSLNTKNGSYILLRGSSGNTGINYMVLIPRDIFYRNNQNSITLLSSLVAVLLIFSALMALFLANFYYKSIRSEQKKNEEISVQLNSRNTLIREMVLRRLIKGNITDDDVQTLEYSLTCSDLHFAYPNFIVALCVSNDLTVTDDTFALLQARLETFSLKNARIYVVCLPEKNEIAAILNCLDKENIQQVLADFTGASIKELGLNSFSAGCGQLHHSVFKIDNSYVEAVVAISEKLNPLPSGSFLFVSRSDSGNGKNHQYPYVEQALIEQSIRNGNAEIAIHSIERVLDKIVQTEESFIIQKCLQFDIINMVVKIASSLSLPLPSSEILRLSSWDNNQALRADLADIIKSLAEKEASAKQQKQTSTKYALLHYVQEHFTENDFTLDKFAEKFDLSYTYISKVFKDETGQSFLSYLTRLRFGYIKKQLEETDLPIKDIIAQAGYYDMTNFLRKFKNIEGMTPGQYRLQHRQN